MAFSRNDTIYIRPGSEEDCDVIMELSKGLAAFVGKLDLVKTTAEGVHIIASIIYYLLHQ